MRPIVRSKNIIFGWIETRQNPKLRKDEFLDENRFIRCMICGGKRTRTVTVKGVKLEFRTQCECQVFADALLRRKY